MTTAVPPIEYAQYQDNGHAPYIAAGPALDRGRTHSAQVLGLAQAERQLRAWGYSPAGGAAQFAWTEPEVGDPSNLRNAPVQRLDPTEESYRGEVDLRGTNNGNAMPPTTVTGRVQVHGTDITLHLPRIPTHLDRRQAVQLANCLMDAAWQAEKNHVKEKGNV